MAERRHRRKAGEASRRNTSFRNTPLRNTPFRNSLSILPSLFTIGNIFCAYYSIMSTLNSRYDQAAIAIGVGYVLDGLDGRVARLTGTNSEFGAQLDSLADVLTFGIAPAILAFSWGIDWMSGARDLSAGDALSPIEQHIRSGGWIVTFAFVICGALRLARFNVMAQRPADATSKRYFIGLPIPAGAGLLASIVHWGKTPIASPGSALLWCLLIGLTAFLMISTIRYHNFKELGIFSRRPRVTLVLAALLIALIFRHSEWTLLLLSVAYAASGPVARLAQLVRRMPLPAHTNRSHGSAEAPPREP